MVRGCIGFPDVPSIHLAMSDSDCPSYLEKAGRLDSSDLGACEVFGGVVTGGVVNGGV